MPILRRDVHVGGFYARDNIRGRTHVRQVIDIYKDNHNKEQVDFTVHNLVRQAPFSDSTSMASFLLWAERETDNPRGYRDISKNRDSFEGHFIIHQHPHPDAYGRNSISHLSGVTISGLDITVNDGSMRAGGGGIKFNDESGEPFWCVYDLIDRITELDGSIIWQNSRASWRE